MSSESRRTISSPGIIGKIYEGQRTEGGDPGRGGAFGKVSEPEIAHRRRGPGRSAIIAGLQTDRPGTTVSKAGSFSSAIIPILSMFLKVMDVSDRGLRRRVVRPGGAGGDGRGRARLGRPGGRTSRDHRPWPERLSFGFAGSPGRSPWRWISFSSIPAKAARPIEGGMRTVREKFIRRTGRSEGVERVLAESWSR